MNPLQNRCGTCARFIRVTEVIDDRGEVKRSGECLLKVWPPPSFETNTCSQYVQKGTFSPRAAAKERRVRNAPATSEIRYEKIPVTLPEELLDMNADEFREVLRDVLREELGTAHVELGGRWAGGELIMKPGKEGTAEKRIPLESLFHKIVMVRDKLRVLEQKINSHPQLGDEEKVQMQQYITGCYGSLTTFNILFSGADQVFTGQKGAKED